MDQSKVVITIVDGKPPIVHIEGHSGPGCEALTKPIIDRLGAVEDMKPTDEFYEPEQVQSQGQQQTVGF